MNGQESTGNASAHMSHAGHAHATGGSGKTSRNLWIGVVDNHSALEQTWVNRANLVAGYAATQSNGTARQFAQAMLVR